MKRTSHQFDGALGGRAGYPRRYRATPIAPNSRAITADQTSARTTK
jgi:hypothetical protein